MVLIRRVVVIKRGDLLAVIVVREGVGGNKMIEYKSVLAILIRFI